MEYRYISCKDFEPTKINMKRHRGKKEVYTAEDFLSLDTETSHNEDRSEAWLYQWCFSYPIEDGVRALVYGRRPSELAEVLYKVCEVCECDEIHNLPIFVHNLSYDYSYIKDALEEKFGHKGALIAVGNHNVLNYNLDGLNFKCSYKLSQKSLDAWCNELGTKHKKLKGTIDYDTERFQDSPLTKKDWKYMFYDIICLDEAIIKQLEKWEDDLITMPLTNTGYVRRETRKNFAKEKGNRRDFLSKKLDETTYTMCRKEFAGGLTHGNRFYAGKTVEGTIRHRDFASHYPSQQMCYSAPCSKFQPYYSRRMGDNRIVSLNELVELTGKKCVLAAIVISDLTLKKGITLPYAQVSKFKEGKIGTEKLDFIEDNGRILKMNSGASLVVVNEYDLKWLLKQYTFSYEIVEIYSANKGPFPKYLRDTVQEFFYKKSFYKAEEKRLEAEGVSKDSEEYKENHLNMMIAKGMLNSIYGMSATDPVRISYFEDENGNWEHEILTEEEKSERIEDFYDKNSSFMNYELGCWTTALARNELMDFVELIGYENFLYADTDSIFYLSTPEIEARIEAKNEEFRKINDANGWYIELEGKRTYYNQFELEKEDITKFRFLHAKCYAYTVKKGDKEELETTIAGVKKYGRNGNSRVKELGSIDGLKSGKIFYDCGGTGISYMPHKLEIVEIDGHLTERGSVAIIKPVTKTLHDAVEVGENDVIIWEVGEIE